MGLNPGPAAGGVAGGVSWFGAIVGVGAACAGAACVGAGAACVSFLGVRNLS